MRGSQDRRSNTVEVECYAGARYPERPRTLTWDGRKLEVERVLREWQTPGERHFQVATEAGDFQLAYREREDAWLARAI